MILENLIDMLQNLAKQVGGDKEIILTNISNPEQPALEVCEINTGGFVDLDRNYYDIVIETEQVSDSLRPFNESEDVEQY